MAHTTGSEVVDTASREELLVAITALCAYRVPIREAEKAILDHRIQAALAVMGDVVDNPKRGAEFIAQQKRFDKAQAALDAANRLRFPDQHH